MEYLEGQTLATRLENGALPLDQALQSAIQIAGALDKGHRQGIVHNDLNPANIMLTKSGAKLLDFGLAPLMAAATVGIAGSTQSPLFGTLPYVAPEQLARQNADARTDIFALGAVLYEMLTGRKAFNGKTHASLIRAILTDVPPPITLRQRLTPPALDHAVKTCLAKDPDERWQSAGDLKSQLTWISEAPAIVDFRQIATLLDGLRALGSERVLDEVLALVMDSAIEVSGAERGCLMLASPGGGVEFKIGRARGGVTLSKQLFETSQKIPRHVFATGQEQILANLMDESLAGQHLDTVALGIRQVLCTPLRVVHYVDRPGARPDQGPIGVMYLDSREKGRLLSVGARYALEAFVTEAAAAIDSARMYRESAEKARLESELQLAAEIQRALLPAACRSGSHFEVASRSIPCRAIGGDFYDYFDLTGGAFGFALGDVAGKGPSAALLAAMIQGIFAAQIGTADSAAALITSVNEGLIRRSLQSRFATCVYGTLAGDGRLTYCNAGHNPPLLIARDGISRLETGGLILGVFPQAIYAQGTLTLAPGDLLVMFSDGVTESFNAAGEQFGEERLRTCLEANRQCSPAELLERLLSAVRSFALDAPQHDDVTALVLRYKVTQQIHPGRRQS
jgi:serine phosphatase RsbU (regulator of sigma subunit)